MFSPRASFPRLFMVANHFRYDEVQELLRKVGIQIRAYRQRAQPLDLFGLARLVGGGQAFLRLEFAHSLRDSKPFRQHIHQGGVDIVDAGTIAGQALRMICRAVGHTILICGQM